MGRTCPMSVPSSSGRLPAVIAERALSSTSNVFQPLLLLSTISQRSMVRRSVGQNDQSEADRNLIRISFADTFPCWVQPFADRAPGEPRAAFITDRAPQQRVEDALGWKAYVDAAHIGDMVPGRRHHAVRLYRSLRRKNCSRECDPRSERRLVRLISEQKQSDDEIARRMPDILFWDPTVPIRAVTVKVEHGLVTWAARYAGRSSVPGPRTWPTVSELSWLNQPTTSASIPWRSPRICTGGIETALHRSAALDAHQIPVSVDDGNVHPGRHRTHGPRVWPLRLRSRQGWV